MATWIVGTIVLIVIGAAAYSQFRPGKKGGCGCGCEGCKESDPKNCH